MKGFSKNKFVALVGATFFVSIIATVMVVAPAYATTRTFQDRCCATTAAVTVNSSSLQQQIAALEAQIATLQASIKLSGDLPPLSSGTGTGTGAAVNTAVSLTPPPGNPVVLNHPSTTPSTPPTPTTTPVIFTPPVTGTSACYTFAANFGQGSAGAMVVALQKDLQTNLSVSLSSEMGTFGPNTFKAVVAFQNKYIAQIGAATGYVGTYTRLELNQLYGCATTDFSNGLSVTLDSSSPAGKNLAAGSVGDQLMVFDLQNTLASRAIQINSIKVTELSGTNQAQFNNLYLWNGINKISAITGTPDTFNLTFLIAPQALIIAPGTTQKITLTADILANPVAGQSSFNLGLGAVSGVNPDLNATITGIGVANGSTFTIVQPGTNPGVKPQPPAPNPTPNPTPAPTPNGAPKLITVNSAGLSDDQLTIGQSGHIVGSGFLSVNTVTIDSTKISAGSTDGSNITFAVPALLAGIHVLTVTNTSGSSVPEAVVFHAAAAAPTPNPTSTPAITTLSLTANVLGATTGRNVTTVDDVGQLNFTASGPGTVYIDTIKLTLSGTLMSSAFAAPGDIELFDPATSNVVPGTFTSTPCVSGGTCTVTFTLTTSPGLASSGYIMPTGGSKSFTLRINSFNHTTQGSSSALTFGAKVVNVGDVLYATKTVANGVTAENDGVTISAATPLTVTNVSYGVGNGGNPPPPTNHLPIGSQAPASCTVIQGWTCDPDSWSTALTVDLYDGIAGQGGTLLGATVANGMREAAVGASCGNGTSAHGFTFATPSTVQDATDHQIYAYGVDAQTGALSLLASSPRTLNCPVKQEIEMSSDQNSQMASVLNSIQAALTQLAQSLGLH